MRAGGRVTDAVGEQLDPIRLTDRVRERAAPLTIVAEDVATAEDRMGKFCSSFAPASVSAASLAVTPDVPR